MKKNLIRLTMSAIMILFIHCSENSPSLLETEKIIDQYSIIYQYPLVIGNWWQYLHYSSTKPTAGTSTTIVDTLIFRVTDTLQYDRKKCWKVARTSSSGKYLDTICALYYNHPDDGFFLYAVDTSFAGEALLKMFSSFTSSCQKLIPRYPKKDTAWSVERTTGSAKKFLNISAISATENIYIISTIIDSDTVSIEKYGKKGLLFRYNYPQSFSDGLTGTAITVSDSISLVYSFLNIVGQK